jgi:DnaJ-class molecular chaperone
MFLQISPYTILVSHPSGYNIEFSFFFLLTIQRFAFLVVNIFCGSLNCYDILGVSRDASIKDIKKVL